MSYPEIPVILHIQESVHFCWLTQVNGRYLIEDKLGCCQGAIARYPDGSWYRLGGLYYPAEAIEAMGQRIDEFEYCLEHSFGFGLEANGRLLYCEVLTGETGYSIYLNSRFIAEVSINDKLQWGAVSGSLLPNHLLQEVGNRIHRHFS